MTLYRWMKQAGVRSPNRADGDETPVTSG
jgi:hypothetical protein